jgi:penicillin-binding protein 1A
MGFTGNFVCGVWFGNDDYTSTNRMTGGALPAQTWHEIMSYAHQGIELKQIPGLPAPTGPQNHVADNGANGGDAVPRSPILTKRSIDVLVQVERLMDDATHALADRGGPDQHANAQDAGAGQRSGAVASAADGQPTVVRGN